MSRGFQLPPPAPIPVAFEATRQWLKQVSAPTPSPHKHRNPASRDSMVWWSTSRRWYHLSLVSSAQDEWTARPAYPHLLTLCHPVLPQGFDCPTWWGNPTPPPERRLSALQCLVRREMHKARRGLLRQVLADCTAYPAVLSYLTHHLPMALEGKYHADE